jgi:hypothetical protein
MDPKTKRAIDEGFGVATAVAFAVPEAGPVLAAMLAGDRMIFDLFFGDTSKDADPKDPLDEPVSVRIFLAAVDELDKAIADLNLDDYLNQTASILKDLKLYYDRAAASPNMPEVDSWERLDVLRGWDGISESYFKQLQGPSPIKSLIDTAMNDPKRPAPVHALSAFVYGVNTFLLLGKMCIMWEYTAAFRKFKQEVDDGKRDKIDLDALSKEIIAQGDGFWDDDPETDTPGAAAGAKPTIPADVKKALAPRATMANVSSFVEIVHSRMAGTADVEGCVPHMEKMLKLINDRYYALPLKEGEIMLRFPKNNGTAKTIVTPVEPDKKYYIDDLSGYYAHRQIQEMIFAQYKPNLQRVFIEEYEIDGHRSLPAFPSPVREHLANVLADWKQAVTNTSVFLNEHVYRNHDKDMGFRPPKYKGMGGGGSRRRPPR